MPQRKKIFLVVSLLYILYTVFPIIPDITGLPVWIVNLLSFTVLFALYPRAFAKPVIYWFVIYATILAIYVLLGKPLTIGIGKVHDSKKIIIEYAFFLPSLSIFSILYFLKDNKLYKIISWGGLLFVTLSFLYLAPFIFTEGTILRDAYHLDLYENMHMLGMPGYPLMHAYILAVPAILYGFRIESGKEKWILLTCILLFVFMIVHTYVTTSLLVTFVVIIFASIYDIKNKTKSFLILFAVLFVVYILHFTGVFIQMFDFLIAFFDGTPTQPKIEGFKYIYMFGDVENSGGDITGRMSLHDMSWLAFSENFLIGGTSPVGGHSSLLDRLGGMGLLAFIPFVMIIFSQVKMTLSLMRNSEQRIYYYLGLGAAFTLLYQKGLFGQEGWLFMMVLMPGLIISFKNDQKSKWIERRVKGNGLKNVKPTARKSRNLL